MHGPRRAFGGMRVVRDHHDRLVVLLVERLQEVQNFVAGLAILAFSVPSVAVRPLVGHIADRRNAALVLALGDPDVRARLKQSGVTPSPGSPAEFGRYLKNEIARYGQLIREKGIKGE